MTRGPASGHEGERPEDALDALVVGAGIAGLACAHALSLAGARVLVLEASDRVGGCIRTERPDTGYVVECGPHTVRDASGMLLKHLHDLGLEQEVIDLSTRGARRYIVRHGRLAELPRSPTGFLTSSFLGPTAKLRLLAEPFVPRRREPDPSLGDFVAHRLGPEVRDGPLDAFVGGVWAGDPQAISARAVMPEVIDGVREHGSLVRYAIARRREGRAPGVRPAAPRRAIFTLGGGLDAWPRRLAEATGAHRVRTSSRVDSLDRPDGVWRVTWSEHGVPRQRFARDVVVTAGPGPTLTLCGPWIGSVAPALARVRSATMSVVHLGYRAGAGTMLPDGFGVLVPRRERRGSLGILFTSALLSGRAPEGHLTTTTFVGGIRSPEKAALPDDELTELAHREHRELLGFEGMPTFRHVVRWPEAIPQYEAGMDALEKALSAHQHREPSLHLAGRYHGGVSVPDCWNRGRLVAERILGRTGGPAVAAPASLE